MSDTISNYAGETLRKLHVIFQKSLEDSIANENDLLTRAEYLGRGVSEVGEALRNDPLPTELHREIIDLFHEVFADVTCSIYLSACASDNPANASLRRAFELGIAIVFLWDCPVRFIAWRD